MATIRPEKLIQEVRKHPALYDQTEELYRNTEYKETIWKKIAIELKSEGQEEECKKKWNGIRDSLRRSFQRRITSSGLTCKYKYENILDFLVPHIMGRKGQNSAPDDDYEASETYDEFHQNSMIEILQPDIKFDSSDSSGTKRKLEPNNCKKKVRRYEPHPVDGFLAAIAPSLKSLDPFNLIKAKGKIFNIVQDFELQQLKSNASAFSTSELAQSPTSSSPSVTSEEE